MLFVKIAFTILFIWLFPLILGTRVMALFQERFEGGKFWLLGMYLHTGIFGLISRIGKIRIWTCEKVLVVWIITSVILLLAGIVYICWKRHGNPVRKENFQTTINSVKYLFLMGIGISIFVCLVHMMVQASSFDTTIVDSTRIMYGYRTETPIAEYDDWNIYIVCISMMSGLAPATIARFVISPFIMTAFFVVLELITSHLFTREKVSAKLLGVLIVLEIGFVLSNHNQRLHLLATTWNKDVIWRYLFCSTLLYVYIIEQEKLLSCIEEGKRTGIIKAIIEILFWVMTLALCGSLWGRLTYVVLLIWVMLITVITLWRRDVFRGRNY